MGRKSKRKPVTKRKNAKKPKRFKRKEFRKLMDVVMDDSKKLKTKYKDPDRWRG
jgi:hypothetical protein